MKIINGFVSNSSFSSFCVWGSWVDTDDIIEKKDWIIPKHEEHYDFEDCELIENKLNEEFSESDICFIVSEEKGMTLIGIPYEKMKDNETGKEFKERAQKEIDKAFGKGIKCQFLCDVIFK